MIVDAVLDQAFLGEGDDLRDRAAFERRLHSARSQLPRVGDEICSLVGRTLDRWQRVGGRIAQGVPSAGADVVADIRSQLGLLVYRGFPGEIPVECLRHYPRYLEAVERRLERLGNDPRRDREKMQQVADLWEECLAYIERARLDGRAAPELEKFRWMIEEFRVSLFAQELKTAGPISRKRLSEQWKKVRRPR